MRNKGFLAIWCEMADDDLQDYRNWLTQEHIADRTFLPGFLGVRLFTRVDNENAHFILYSTSEPNVLQSKPYIEVLNNPSPWTKRIMPRFGAFDRATGAEAVKLGNGFGSFVTVCRLKTAINHADAKHPEGPLSKYQQIDGVVSTRLMTLDGQMTDIDTEEKTMRIGNEGTFPTLLCFEAFYRNGAQLAAQNLHEDFGSDVIDTGVYQVLYGEAPHEGPTV